MPTFRTRATIAILFAAVAFSGCGMESTSPLEPTTRPVSADVDTVKRTPTLPWTKAQTSSTPTLPWTKVQSASTPTLPWT
ncbi:MAG TPA: hypothetical protein VE861_03450 [Gemmatimonadaceae bacterium]|nr:hypothetical protein [Gemmatimonadaceae bacterium]